jgi:ketosteroid isomerase-like protein
MFTRVCTCVQERAREWFEMRQAELAVFTTARGFDIAAWVDALNRGDIESLRTSLTEDCVIETLDERSTLAGRWTSSEFLELVELVVGLTRGGLGFSVSEIIADDERVAVELTGRTELADGTIAHDVILMVLHLRDGRITRIKTNRDAEILDAVLGRLTRS